MFYKMFLLSLCVNSVLDTNDRFLRKITIGQSPTEKGYTREVTEKIHKAVSYSVKFSRCCNHIKTLRLVGLSIGLKEGPRKSFGEFAKLKIL